MLLKLWLIFTRDFGVPTILGLVSTAVFWYLYRDIDKEEYKLSQNDEYLEEHAKVAHNKPTK